MGKDPLTAGKDRHNPTGDQGIESAMRRGSDTMPLQIELTDEQMAELSRQSDEDTARIIADLGQRAGQAESDLRLCQINNGALKARVNELTGERDELRRMLDRAKVSIAAADRAAAGSWAAWWPPASKSAWWPPASMRVRIESADALLVYHLGLPGISAEECARIKDVRERLTGWSGLNPENTVPY